MTRDPISVVVPTRDREVHLPAALASIRDALEDSDELVVVDSASVRADVEEIARNASARYVRCERPGVGIARNAGWRAASNDPVAFVDDDVRVAPAWAETIAELAAAHPDVAFFTGWIGVPEGQGDSPRLVATKLDPEPARLDHSTHGNLGHSANLVVRRRALEAVGGFDEAMGAGGPFKSSPEVDLFDRLFAAGFVGRYSPEIRAWHDQWRDRGELLRLDWRYGFGAGARFAKLVRTDRRRARGAAFDFLWEWTGRELLAGLRDRSKSVVAAALARLGGVLAGFLRAAFVPVRDGHFALRRHSRSSE